MLPGANQHHGQRRCSVKHPGQLLAGPHYRAMLLWSLSIKPRIMAGIITL